jgi:hypothetical protein
MPPVFFSFYLFSFGGKVVHISPEGDIGMLVRYLGYHAYSQVPSGTRIG